MGFALPDCIFATPDLYSVTPEQKFARPDDDFALPAYNPQGQKWVLLYQIVFLPRQIYILSHQNRNLPGQMMIW
ncbi:hypothetical protein DMA11_20620 [Marinilabiliaceae bacterium JC017]|nr:hypothetical protein DMA11_20620 [Marinilabiliaceae bacterium JC017]